MAVGIQSRGMFRLEGAVIAGVEGEDDEQREENKNGNGGGATPKRRVHQATFKRFV
jgi:hypothetical protein